MLPMRGPKFHSRGRLPISRAFLYLCLLLAAAALPGGVAEVSGPGEVPFLLSREGPWSYEAIPGVSYSFYRSTSPDSGYVCIYDGQLGNSWAGDPLEPSSGLFFYL